MTREEAIDLLKDLWNEVYNEDSDGYDFATAIDMAIEALKADIARWSSWNKTFEQSGIADLISRADAMQNKPEFLNPELSEYNKGWNDAVREYWITLKTLPLRPSALPSAEAVTHEIRTETHGVCSDIISRADAVEQIKEWAFGQEFKYTNATEYLLKRIASIPSADRPSGEWVIVNQGLDIYICGQCGEVEQIQCIPIWGYCPNCGAKMGSDTR